MSLSKPSKFVIMYDNMYLSKWSKMTVVGNRIISIQPVWGIWAEAVDISKYQVAEKIFLALFNIVDFSNKLDIKGIALVDTPQPKPRS
jgi:hypothetical protein